MSCCLLARLLAVGVVGAVALPMPGNFSRFTDSPFNLTKAEEAWKQFAAAHPREHDTENIQQERRTQFIKRWQFVMSGNARAGARTFKINELADYTKDEMKALTQGYKPLKKMELNRNYELELRARASLGLVEEITG